MTVLLLTINFPADRLLFCLIEIDFSKNSSLNTFIHQKKKHKNTYFYKIKVSHC